MRTIASAVLLTLAVTVSAFATTTGVASSRGQSYFTYDDGGTIVRSGEDGKEIDGRVNLPLYPGDEVLTNRRGRAEIRLSDGNVIGLDRSTSVVFKAMNNSYDGNESADTVAELKFGHVVVQRLDANRELLRLDSENASYVAVDEAVYSVEADGRGKDRVTVFDGTIEVRTPSRTTRLRTGEEAHVDDSGLYGLVTLPRDTADDFERWFIKRGERYTRDDSKYLDRSLAYAESDLSDNGSWIYVSAYGGWAWRPFVSAGWRPYYSGHWSHSRSGCLTWVSYEPWGWVPYHYGRWSYDPGFGWVWLPGSGYAPAWVYWIYGPQYIGWAPAGWYDCYRPYYNWAYRPYHRADFGFGFYGRVRVHDIDLRPWTFVTPGTLFNNRVDRAALTADLVRERIMRGGDGFATVSGSPARFSRNDLKDPASAIGNIARRGLGSGTGKEGSGSPTDMTPFFRRDPDLSKADRDRIVRTRPSDGGIRAAVGGGSSSSGSTITVPSGGAILPGEPRNGADRGAIERGAVGAERGVGVERGSGGTINRGDWRREGGTTTTPSPSERSGIGSISRGETPATPAVATPETTRPSREAGSGAVPAWRERGERVVRPTTGETQRPVEPPRATEGSTPPVDRGSDIPRRIIDRIGGARSRPAESAPRGDSGRSSGSSRSSGGNSGSSSGGSTRSTPPPPPPAKSSPPPPQRTNDGGGQRDGGSRDKQ